MSLQCIHWHPSVFTALDESMTKSDDGRTKGEHCPRFEQRNTMTLNRCRGRNKAPYSETMTASQTYRQTGRQMNKQTQTYQPDEKHIKSSIETVCRNRNKQVCVQLPTCAINTTLPAFATERRAAAPLVLSAGACCTVQQSINVSCLPGAQQQTSRMPLCSRPMWRTDRRRQTDGRT